MKINKFTKLKNGMYSLLLENNVKLIVHEDLILKYDLLIKKELEEKEKEKIIEENKTYQIYEESIKYINKKLRSSKELKKYLEKKEYDIEDINRVIDLLYKQGYLNDNNYASSYIHDRIVLSNDGPNKIKDDLEKNGISTEIIDNMLSNYTEELEKERIEKLVDKQIKLNNNKGTNLLKRKIQMNLLNLGYNYDLINKCLNNKVLVDDNLYKKEYNKLYQKLSKKYSGKELEYHLKQKLYQKGFNYNDYE